jgi:hypothetical protein
MRQAGAIVEVVRADVSRESELRPAIARLTESQPPLRGVVHAAGLMEENTVLAHQDWGRFARVLAPKVEGAWLLHQLTLGATLDFFVMFSSAATVLGVRGQADYTAANAFLDGLAHHRRALGLPALSINWGGWAEAGVIARGDLQARFARHGLFSFSTDRGLELLEYLLQQHTTQGAALSVDWTRFDADLGESAERPFFAAVLDGHPSPTRDRVSVAGGSEARRRLEQAPVKKRRQVLLDHIREQIRQVLDLGMNERVPEDKPLLEMGLDSLMSVELRNRLQTGVASQQSLPATLVFDYPTASALTSYLLEVVFPMGTTVETRAAPRDRRDDGVNMTMLDRLEQLPDEEIEQLLAMHVQRGG